MKTWLPNWKSEIEMFHSLADLGIKILIRHYCHLTITAGDQRQQLTVISGPCTQHSHQIASLNNLNSLESIIYTNTWTVSCIVSASLLFLWNNWSLFMDLRMNVMPLKLFFQISYHDEHMNQLNCTNFMWRTSYYFFKFNSLGSKNNKPV